MSLTTDIVFTRIYHSLEDEFGYLSKFGCIEISNGLCWLAAVTRKHDYNTRIIDALPLKVDNGELAKLIVKEDARYVGISACTMDIHASADLAERLKKMKPGIVTIIGGAHVTAVPDETMKMFPSFDFAVIGEGEETIIELLDSLKKKEGMNLAEVDGIVYRDKGNIVATKPRNFIKDLDSLPLPAWDLLPDLRKNYFAPAWTMHSGNNTTIITSRGCPSRCTYCDRKVFGNTVRYHSAAYVLDMLKTLHFKHDINHFRISDDNFMIHKKRLSDICGMITKEGLGISWSCLARADSIDSGILKEMKGAGCWSIAFGVETGSQRIHDIEKKNIKLEQIARAVALTRKTGIKTISFNMIGHPTETIQTIKETIRFNKKIKVDEFKTQFLTPFPGTELYADAEKYGTLDRDWRKMGVFKDPVFVPYGLTKEEMIGWNKKGFRSFYLQPRTIVSYIKQMRNPAEFKMILVGALTLLGWTIKELFSKKTEKRRVGRT